MRLSNLQPVLRRPPSDGRETLSHGPVRKRQTARIMAVLVASAAFASLFALGSGVRADVTYTYNSHGRLTQVCNGSGQGVTYGYDPDGNITSVRPTPCATPTATATP